MIEIVFDLSQVVIIEAKLLHRASREIFGHDVTYLNKSADDLQTAIGSEVDADGALGEVDGVEERGQVRSALAVGGAHVAADFRHLDALDLDRFGLQRSHPSGGVRNRVNPAKCGSAAR